MSANIPTFEEVDEHIKNADLSALQSAAKAGPGAGGLAAIPAQACQAYSTVRPILQLVAATPFIPSRWRDAIKAFVSVMDMVCGQAQPQP